MSMEWGEDTFGGFAKMPAKETAAQEPMPDTKGASQNTDSVTSGNERPSGGFSPNYPVAAAPQGVSGHITAKLVFKASKAFKD